MRKDINKIIQEMYEREHTAGYAISDADRVDASEALAFCNDLKLPLNIHIRLNTELQRHQEERNIDYWRFVHQKLRVYCDSHDFECVMICTRSTDPAGGGREEQHFRIHIPEHLKAHFMKLASKWSNDLVVALADHDATVGEDGKVHSSFNTAFKAASQASTLFNPTILVEPSGRIVGPRVFLSRKISRLRRAAFYKKRKAAEQA